MPLSRTVSLGGPPRPPGHRASRRPQDQVVRRLAGAFAREPELVLACVEGGVVEPAVDAHTIVEAGRLALTECPDYADLTYFTAQAAAAAGEFGTAELLLERALELNPTYVDAMVLSARLALRRRLTDRAIKLLDRALAQGATYPDVYCLLGDAWRVRGDARAARRAYLRALSLNRDLSTAKAGLAAMGADTTRGESDELPA